MTDNGRLFLFLIYFPRATPTSLDPDAIKGLDQSKQPTFRTAVIVTWICVVHAVATMIISIVFTTARPDLLQDWANFLGILSTVLAAIQYFPQIWTTYMIKRVGSLSIPMMCIQTPGSFVWAASLAARLGPSGWSAWGVYCVTGVLQGTLLAMGVVYELRHRKQERAELEARIAAADGGDEPRVIDETTPLVQDQ